MRKIFLALLIAGWVLLVLTRIAGPSDLYDKEQPRTIAYTADILNDGGGHWVLPYDTFGIPATKPPLYNWISVPFVAAFGYQEWALKIPSVLGSLMVMVGIYFGGRWMERRSGGEIYADGVLPLLAPLLWLATPMSAKLLYVARPDMLLTGFLTGGWVAATVMLQSPKPNRAAQIAFWGCAIGAALTKGPSALLAIGYLVLGAKVLAGKWGTLRRSGWWWGLPLLLIVAGAVTYSGYLREPEFYRQVLLGREVAGRVTRPGQVLSTVLNGPVYMVTRFLPWSLLALFMFFRIPLRRWFSHALGPAILWVLMILVVFSFMTTKRPDRYAPVFPMMALLAGYAVLRLPAKWRSGPAAAAGLAFALIIGLAAFNQFFSEGATTHYGEHAIAFAHNVEKITGNDDILFTDGELTPVETLLGRNQPPQLARDFLERAKWSVGYYQPGSDAVVVSESLQQINGQDPGQLALYRLAPGEGVRLYEEARKQAKRYAGNATSNSGPGDSSGRWQQFSRVHK